MRIDISYDHGVLRLSRKETIRTIDGVTRRERKRLKALSVVYTNNSHIRTINRKHLKHDYVTDVITFEIEPHPALEAEIYINLDRARGQARLYRQSFAEETKRLLIHGLLHVMGYNDASPAARKRMSRKEDGVLAGLRREKK
jgi:rRNA maturation RNase YbeY